MKPGRTIAVVVLIAAVAGCAGEIAPIDTSSQLEVGTGEDGFRPLEDGDELQVVLGPQGGYHVVGNARIEGFAPADAFADRPDGVRFSLVADDGTPLNLDLGGIQTALVRQPDGSYVCAPGHHVLVNGDPAELDGQTARFSALMRTVEDQMTIDERYVVLVVVGPGA